MIKYKYKKLNNLNLFFYLIIKIGGLDPLVNIVELNLYVIKYIDLS